MEVICKKNQGTFLPLILAENIVEKSAGIVASTEAYTNADGSLGYSLRIGNKYPVHGILIADNNVRFLVFDECCNIGFFPLELFDIYNPCLNIAWEIGKFQSRQKTVCIISYPEFTKDYAVLRDLVDCKNHAIELFLKAAAYYKDSLII